MYRHFLISLLIIYTSANVVIQFSDRIEKLNSLIDRNKRWAYINNYEYRLESVRKWPERSVYFEKVRMTIEALEGGAEWVFHIDDDAMINFADQTVEEWIEKYPDKDFIISPQPHLEWHNISAGHYHNWGVFIAKRTPWVIQMFHEIYDSERCANVQVEYRVGNPEQDCFAMFVYNTPFQLEYPYDILRDNDTAIADLDVFPLNMTTLSHIGEPYHIYFNCIAVDKSDETCAPWIFHFSQSAKDDLPYIDPSLVAHYATEMVNTDGFKYVDTYGLPCTVVAVASGLMEARIRIITSSFVYSTEFQCQITFVWPVDDEMPYSWEELFNIDPLDMPFDLENDPHRLDPTSDWINSVNPYRVPFVAIYTPYKPEYMSSYRYARMEERAYQILVPFVLFKAEDYEWTHRVLGN